MMDLGFRLPVGWILILFMCGWLFFPYFKSGQDQFDYCDNAGYSMREFDEDMCKIYYDLGRLSQRRGDFHKAIQSYSIALAYNPEHLFCLENLEYCKDMLKKNLSNAVEFFARLDSFK